MPVEPIHFSALGLDLSPRIVQSTTVAASPGGSSETVIATLSVPSLTGEQVISGVIVIGWATFTVGTNGVSANLKLYDTLTASGELLVATGALTVVAANLVAFSVQGFDVEGDIGSYCMTLTVGSGSAASTVSALQLLAIVV